MATTAKIAKEERKLAEIAAGKKAGTPVRFKTRLRNRCKRCGRPRGFFAQVLFVPDLLPPACSGRRNSRRDKG